MPVTVMLDAGHGGVNPGAVYEGRQEKDDALALVLAMAMAMSMVACGGSGEEKSTIEKIKEQGKKAKELVRNLVLRGVEKLKNLFKGSRSRSEIVATFLAVLDLCKTNSVTLEDDTSGENPTVRLINEADITIEGDDVNGTN